MDGFINGFDKEYKAKVKSKYPKMVEEAIQIAKVFDNTIDKKHTRNPSSEFFSHGPRASKHMKNFTPSMSESPKNTKASHDPLTPNFARAKKKKNVFNAYLVIMRKRTIHSLDLTRWRRERISPCTWCSFYL